MPPEPSVAPPNRGDSPDPSKTGERVGISR